MKERKNQQVKKEIISLKRMGYATIRLFSGIILVGTSIGIKAQTNNNVILNDYEDHNWSYYKGLDYTFDDGITYKDKYIYSIYSPDPRNVKITYRGYDTETNKIYIGNAQQNISYINDYSIPKVSNATGEDQNTFIYYKTLEKFVIGFFEQNKATNGDWDGTPAHPNNTAEQYPYTVISNPFSVRPSTGTGNSKTYYGFAGWKIISGGDKILEYNNGDVIPLDAVIHFTNLENIAGGKYTPNCTSAEVVFEATWTEATVWSGDAAHIFNNGTYETNFIVASGNIASITQTSPCTIIGMNPDGTEDNSAIFSITTLTVGTTGSTSATNTVKVEWIMHGDDATSGRVTTPAFNANGKNLTLGRGITSSNKNAQGTIYGDNSTSTCSNIVKIESGNYSAAKPYNKDKTNADIKVNCFMIFGCDYDRARTDYYVDNIEDNAYNTKLQIDNPTLISGQNGKELNSNNGQLYYMSLFKSGIYTKDYYAHNTKHLGQRFVMIEGGYFKANITGGCENTAIQPNARSLTIRGRGNFRVDGRIAGGSTQQNCSGDRNIVLTGGRVKGWIAAGSGSNDEEGGVTTGSSFVYIGGNTQIDSNGSTEMFNASSGGVVYGAGCGINHNSQSGQMTKGSNVVLADKAYVERGIYGGGAMGRLPNGQTANIFVLGGHVGTGIGKIKDGANPTGEQEVTVSKSGIFGGACNVGGGGSNIYMNGGLVEGGVFGGSNITGTMGNNVKIQIDGGQVGTEDASANIHGGGYGQTTIVSGNVDIILGATGAARDAEGATVWGDVYGGSALGSVNGTTTTTAYHTNVTLNAGTINGSLYGGALGDASTAANVYGPVLVTVNGGKVVGDNSAVYGCNNMNGAPQRTVRVVVNGTDSHNNNGTANDYTDDTYAINAVYGGGNQAAYTYGIPTVTVNNCDNSIKYVYGGGNQATVPATSVTINGGNIIDNVFGGGNNADVTGTDVATENQGTRVNINGGRILNVYGGNNNGGAITGTIKVNVAEPANATCPVNVSDLYGGGNKAASNAGQITIGKCTNITRVFGGANQADVTGPINLNIVDGNIGTVFGGNNNSGEIDGAITVNVNWNGTENRSLGSVYGAGNLAPYTGNPTVNIINATTTGSVFGGGLGESAVVVGNPKVNIGVWKQDSVVVIGGSVFGGGDEAAVEGNPVIVIRDCNTAILGDLYGGGNAAPVYSTNTTMWGGTVAGNVFGGGNGADPDKNPNGAQIGYKSDDTTLAKGEGVGNAVTNIYGGTIGKWEEVDGVETCTAGGGIFGGSNTNGNIAGKVVLTVDQRKCTEKGAADCTPLKMKELYGSGNEAAYAGTGIDFNLGCVDGLDEIYGGAKNADMNGDIHLIISSGHFKRVFGGNNIGGRINGNIKVSIDETGCNPVIIEELYCGGNQAAYSVYGYNDDGTVKTTGEKLYADPEVEVISCTHIGQVFGGGLGASAKVVGTTNVLIDEIPGDHWDKESAKPYVNKDKLGSIGDVFGGGNAADIEGFTNVKIGTKATNAHLAKEGVTTIDTTSKPVGANITGNVYGGGNQANVTGKTFVTVGPEKTTNP